MKPLTATYLQAAEDHYKELHPTLQKRDNLLIFANVGVILIFEDDKVVLVRGMLDSALTPMAGILTASPATNLCKINQMRAWNYIYKRVKAISPNNVAVFDYGDPRLFKRIDEALVNQPKQPVTKR